MGVSSTGGVSVLCCVQPDQHIQGTSETKGEAVVVEVDEKTRQLRWQHHLGLHLSTVFAMQGALRHRIVAVEEEKEQRVSLQKGNVYEVA